MKKFKMAWSRSEKKHRNPFEKETEFGFEVESLESRKMLAGNVDVVVTADNSLVITGDNANNNITVIDGQGDIFVLGVDGTIVANGGSTGLALTDLNKLTIKMKGGDDSVVVASDVSAQGRVRMTGAAGRDILQFFGVAGEKLQIIGGSGDDVVGIANGATVAGKLTLKGGANNDVLFIDSSTANGKAIVNGGGGDDVAGVCSATFTSDVKANMGHGADRMDIFGVVLGPKTTLAFGGGDDVLIVTDVPTIPAGGTVLINGGGGTDLSDPDPATLDAIAGVTVKSFEGLFVP